MSRKPRSPHPDETMRACVAELRLIRRDLANGADPARLGERLARAANRLDRMTRTPEPER